MRPEMTRTHYSGRKAHCPGIRVLINEISTARLYVVCNRLTFCLVFSILPSLAYRKKIFMGNS